jgi:hypothetical protein
VPRFSVAGEAANQSMSGVGWCARGDPALGKRDAGIARSGQRVGEKRAVGESGRGALVVMMQGGRL